MKIKRYLVEAPVNNIDVISKIDNDEELRSKILEELQNNGFEIAAIILERFTTGQFVYFVQSLGKNALADEDNIFLNFLNNKNADKALTDFRAFTKAYNILINPEFNTTDFLNWIKNNREENCILYDSNLYDKIDSINIIREVVNIDFKFSQLLKGVKEGLDLVYNTKLNEAEYTTPSGLLSTTQAGADDAQARFKAKEEEKEKIERQKAQSNAREAKVKLRDYLSKNKVEVFLKEIGIKAKADDPAWKSKMKTNLKNMDKNQRQEYVKKTFPEFSQGQINSFLSDMGF